jgi:hypothetical protein
MKTAADITTEEFDQAVRSLAEKDGVTVLLSIDGVWELVSEFYNNDAIRKCLGTVYDCPDCGSDEPPPDGEEYGRCPDCAEDVDTVYKIYERDGAAGVLKYMLEVHPQAHQRYCVPCEAIYPILDGACSVCGTEHEPSPHGYTDDIDGDYQYDDDGNVIHRPTTCGTCHRTWNDAIISGATPVPSARCPFEYEHKENQ